MLTPEFLQACADEVTQIAEHIDAYAIRKIAERMTIRLEKGKKALSQTDIYQIRAMQETGALVKDISDEITRISGLEAEVVESSIVQAGIVALEAEDAVYKAQGLQTSKASVWVTRLAERNARKCLNTIRNVTGTFAKSAGNEFVLRTNQAWARIMSGAQSAGGAIIDAIKDMSAKGVKVTYGKNDRPEKLEVATARAIRTSIAQTNGDIAIKRMEEMEWDIILVSAHVGARNVGTGYENHEAWQGKFYSLSGNDPRFPDFYSSTGYGELLGLCGVNCRHSFGAGDGEHNPYTLPTHAENDKQYTINQQARAKERKIRALKKQRDALQASLRVATDPQTKEELDKALKSTRKRLREHNEAYREFCNAHGMKVREERLAI